MLNFNSPFFLGSMGGFGSNSFSMGGLSFVSPLSTLADTIGGSSYGFGSPLPFETSLGKNPFSDNGIFGPGRGWQSPISSLWEPMPLSPFGAFDEEPISGGSQSGTAGEDPPIEDERKGPPKAVFKAAREADGESKSHLPMRESGPSGAQRPSPRPPQARPPAPPPPPPVQRAIEPPASEAPPIQARRQGPPKAVFKAAREAGGRSEPPKPTRELTPARAQRPSPPPSQSGPPAPPRAKPPAPPATTAAPPPIPPKAEPPAPPPHQTPVAAAPVAPPPAEPLRRGRPAPMATATAPVVRPPTSARPPEANVPTPPAPAKKPQAENFDAKLAERRAELAKEGVTAARQILERLRLPNPAVVPEVAAPDPTLSYRDKPSPKPAAPVVAEPEFATLDQAERAPIAGVPSSTSEAEPESLYKGRELSLTKVNRSTTSSNRVIAAKAYKVSVDIDGALILHESQSIDEESIVMWAIDGNERSYLSTIKALHKQVFDHSKYELHFYYVGRDKRDFTQEISVDDGSQFSSYGPVDYTNNILHSIESNGIISGEPAKIQNILIGMLIPKRVRVPSSSKLAVTYLEKHGLTSMQVISL